MTMTVVRPLPVSGCGVLSPAGFGLTPLADAIAGQQTGCSDPAEIVGDETLPEPIRVVPGLRPREILGRKGTRFLDRTTALGLVTSRMALESVPEATNEDAGVVIGTSTGSVRSSSEFARDTLTQEKPYLVNPGLFPNTVMNGCAGQIAIWNSLRGVNATLSGGQVSSLHAIRYARNALDQGQADRLLVGGVEELSPQTAWAWRRSGSLSEDTPVGEACGVFVVDGQQHGPADDVLVELLACEVGHCPAPDRRPKLLDGLTRCVERAVARSGLDTGDTPELVSLSASSAGSGERRIEESAIGRVFDAAHTTIRVKDTVGECYSASGVLQLAAALAHWRTEPRADEAAPRIALITSVGRDGNVGCLVVREGAGVSAALSAPDPEADRPVRH